MEAAEIRKSFDDLLDTGLLHFGFVDYLRDFHMYFYFSTYDANVMPHFIRKYRFVNCVVADCSTTLSPEVWKRSLDDSLIVEVQADDQPTDGWVWATRHGDMYPGATLVESSREADRWSASVGVKFHEAILDAPPVRVRLIFSDLVIEPAKPGVAPFTVERPLGA